jgi:hypothetical protein
MPKSLYVFVALNIFLQFSNSAFYINMNGMYDSMRGYWMRICFTVLVIDLFIFSNLVPIFAMVLRILVFKYKSKRFFGLYRFFEKLKNSQKYK